VAAHARREPVPAVGHGDVAGAGCPRRRNSRDRRQARNSRAAPRVARNTGRQTPAIPRAGVAGAVIHPGAPCSGLVVLHQMMEAAFSRITMTAASAMLLLSLVVLWRRHASAYITAFRTQSITLAVTGAIVASYGGAPELFFVSFMILVV